VHVWGRNLCAVTMVWLSDPFYSRSCTTQMPNLEFTIFTYAMTQLPWHNFTNMTTMT
jgi:hypothetical protein